MTTAVACPDPEDRSQVEVDERESERGLATAEYAIATLAAAGFAGVLLAILKGGDVKAMLTSLVQSALSIG
ncbi:Protein of unknown function (DUF4244) [Promicromonospora umidemergens]|uniref:DUF4244 domain-containing protein n=2 Tax=Promicromonospora umidemergens TaxID=629679 RepID=A0ABP8X2X7_9MICO|nr:Protein of unknown function (DUF4244) [Promicromonospora umidemergens]